MSRQPQCIMLIDDYTQDNFFHEREIKKNNPATTVIIKNTGTQALAYLKSKKEVTWHPELIFLDVNMPGMNGWEFVKEHDKLELELRARLIIVMFSNSEGSDEKNTARCTGSISDYIIKPLTITDLQTIIDKYFKEKILSENF